MFVLYDAFLSTINLFNIIFAFSFLLYILFGQDVSPTFSSGDVKTRKIILLQWYCHCRAVIAIIILKYSWVLFMDYCFKWKGYVFQLSIILVLHCMVN